MAATVGFVSAYALRLDGKRCLGSLDHRSGRNNLLREPRRRRFNIKDDVALVVDEIVIVVAQLPRDAALGRPCPSGSLADILPLPSEGLWSSEERVGLWSPLQPDTRGVRETLAASGS